MLLAVRICCGWPTTWLPNQYSSDPPVDCQTNVLMTHPLLEIVCWGKPGGDNLNIHVRAKKKYVWNFFELLDRMRNNHWQSQGSPWGEKSSSFKLFLFSEIFFHSCSACSVFTSGESCESRPIGCCQCKMQSWQRSSWFAIVCLYQKICDIRGILLNHKPANMLRLTPSFEKQRQEGEILVATNLHAEGKHDGGGEGGTTR